MSETTNRDTNANRLKNLLYKFKSDPDDGEFEVKFGTKGIKRINRSDIESVMNALKTNGFNATQIQRLTIQNEYRDSKGVMRISNIRAEIPDTSIIQKVCKDTNNHIWEGSADTPNYYYGVEFVNKTTKFNEDGSRVDNVDTDEFNFRASFKTEKKLAKSSGVIKAIVRDWDNTKKIFRLVTRYTFQHIEYPNVKVDISIVRSSKKNKDGFMVRQYNTRDAEIFTQPPSYEVEIEVFNDRFNDITRIENERLLNTLRKTIRIVLMGLQRSKYPISYPEMKQISNEYIELVYGKEERQPRWLSPKNFIGPSSISLEQKNIQPLSEDIDVPNIRRPYTVTDKADGERKMMYISESGKIYFIDTSMRVQFTGMITNSKEHKRSLLDGEFITKGIDGSIYKYAAFDIYYNSGEDQRKKHFINIGDVEAEKKMEYRLNVLNEFVRTLKPTSVVKNAQPLDISTKLFEVSVDEKTIFNKCAIIYKNAEDNLYPYETDGLIFTPCDLGVGMYKGQDKPNNFKKTWEHSFKWKPPQFNTIDFLVKTVKNEAGQDVVKTIFEEGNDMSSTSSLNKYKSLVLCVGYDEKIHGYMNPCEQVIQGNVPKQGSETGEEGYRPLPFIPTNPFIENSYLCNIMLSGFGADTMTVEDDTTQVITDNTIVEFKYVASNEPGWRWIPIRVRSDKTDELRSGVKNYGNAYHVAESVWRSINNPITKEMITTGVNIPLMEENDDVYYNPYGISLTKPMRDFHNLYVKNTLIRAVSPKGGSLIDLAVGKGGDIPKWIEAKLKFVLGIDVSKDNIENRVNGACARYLNYRKEHTRMPRALFVQGNSKLNIRNGDGLFTDKGKQIVRAVNGRGEKDRTKLGEGVYRQYGIGEDGFDVVSCQFAIHYFFETPETLHNFLQNVSENCREGGYFIGTSYDGKTVFRELRDIEAGESISEYKDEKKIWEITKGYEQRSFDNDTSSIGLAINVFQETINKSFVEYLVNYEYLTELLKLYGFELVGREEAREMQLPNGTGMFSELFSSLKDTNKRERSRIVRDGVNTKIVNKTGTAILMDNDIQQKRISFLNRYFVYKKVANVNAEEVKNTLLRKSGDTEKERSLEDKETEETIKTLKEVTEEVTATKPKKTKKLGKKLKLKMKPSE